MSLLHSVRTVGRKLGVEVFRATPMTMWNLRLPKLLEQRRVISVLDVGANDGGFASDLFSGGFKGDVVSFEPLPTAWQTLSRRAEQNPRWKIAPPMALSSENGRANFYEAGNSVSSSLLPMTEVHSSAAPESQTVGCISVETRKLDDILGSLCVDGPIFLKLDVQGAEKLVLEGAIDALTNAIVGAQLEMSLDRLYDGQASADVLDALLKSFGFKCWDIIPGFRDPKTLQLLQYDGIYFRD